MSTLLFANNATSTLAGSISNVATTCNLSAGTGALFPNPGFGEYFVMTFTDNATGLINEIVYVTGRSTDTLTIERGKEGTSAIGWAAGDLASALITAGMLASFQQLPNNLAVSGVYAVDTGTTNAISIDLDDSAPLAYSEILGSPIRVMIANTNTGDATFSIVGLAALNIITPDGNLVSQYQLRAGAIAVLSYDGSEMQLLSITTPQPLADIVVLSGAGTWTVPSGWFACEVQLIAGGGGGAGGDGTFSGGGGGAGGAVVKTFTNLNPGFTAAYSVGAAGAAGTTTTNGGAGGNSSFVMDYPAIPDVTISATGGSGGTYGANPAGGDGGTGTGGPGSAGFGGFNIAGGPGGDGMYNANALGGNGAPSPLFGGGGRAAYSAHAAQAGKAPGAGGGGGYGNVGCVGGVGAAGTIVIRPVM